MDLNGLINTIIASTAALVAIIGGFLVSRVLALSSERVAVERRFNEINNNLRIKEEMLKETVHYIFEEDLNDFFKDNCEKVLWGQIPLQEIVEEDEYTALTGEEIEPYVEEFKSLESELKLLIKNNSSNVTSDFEEFIKEKEIRLPDKKLWYEFVYDAMYEKYVERENSNTLYTFGAGLNTLPDVTAAQSYKDKVKERNNLQDELRFLKMQKTEQNKILQDYVKPKGLWGGLIVLVYACIVGIVYPSTLLPYPEKAYSVTLKWVLLGLFFSQLAALFAYLFISLYSLTKFSKRNL
ncbi:hypothetical protein MKY06_30135 [Priestia sp. FSL P4-0332]|uniref:hypothetical protein n=1 Tax=Priestia sp. FSL P4-0332 TaxID=2921634 RepID=UPI0030F77924